MENLYHPEDAQKHIDTYASWPEALALRIYTSRLIGKNRQLVLHGGGNTSVKCRVKNLLGDEERVLYVKGSGRDLATIDPEGFTGLRLNPLQRIGQLRTLSDSDMENELAVHRTASQAPNPSVEALLHAFLPHTYIDHSHADSILVLTNQKDGESLIRDALGKGVAVVPYVMSGFPLAKSVLSAYEKKPDAEAIVVIHHGIFTFGETAEAAYRRMIRYVTDAEAFIEDRLSGKSLTVLNTALSHPKDPGPDLARCAHIIRGVFAQTGEDPKPHRRYVESRTAPDLVEASLSVNAEDICRSGVLTPDHVIRTKYRMVYIDSVSLDDAVLKQRVTAGVEAFKSDYLSAYAQYINAKGLDRPSLDPHPRVFLIAGIGLMALGITRRAACVAADIGEQTIRAKLRAFAVGAYEPISDAHVFDMEHWGLQQKKLARPSAPPLEGQIALVTGAAGAIGFGIADRLLAAGAVVVLSDIDSNRMAKAYALLAETYGSDRVRQSVIDVTDYASVEKAFGDISRTFGGVDILVPNAGIAHVARIEDLDPERLDRVIAVNLKGTFTVIKAAVPIFRRQGTGGNIVLISSKNVFDPGAAFSAYSAAKAGAHQIAKIAAIELADLGVRVNMINPDAVFGDEKVSSKLWDEIGPDRMRSRGLDAEGLKDYYRQRSLLKVQVLGEHVGNAVVFFASELTPTTGASLPVDAGNSAAFPR
jgi:rhamnose utilization protein RhaD (predicted bifunctional aldolase and dehydrogenase)/NAD(P)-dependent dehydrogenase (short-subunit alcohol dehydrogenase family)